MRTFLLLAVLAVAFLGTAKSARATNYNVGLSDSSTTSDSTDPFTSSGFTCDTNASNFFCTQGGFVCYGWGNCSALGATDGAPDLATFLTWSAVGTDPKSPDVDTPEPDSLILLGSGLVMLVAKRGRVSVAGR